MVSFLGCTAHEDKSALDITPNCALTPSASHLLFLDLSRRLPSSAVVHPPVFFFFESYASFSLFARPGAVTRDAVLAAFAFPFVSFMGRWVGGAPLRSTIELPRRMAGCWGPMQRRIAYS